MPKENKHSRGRREEKKLKRKRNVGEEDSTASIKRQKPQSSLDDVNFVGTDNAEFSQHAEPVEGEEAAEGVTTERPFYGMLEDEEQEYFRRADELLELNDFPSDEERSIFLTSVYREAEGKELKIACSQSCSRLMERLILLSSTEQKKKLFEKFSGNFAHLVQHRFASHCCETLFIQSAPVVTEELTADFAEAETSDTDIGASMENLFLYTLNELEGQMTFLLTDRFASHTLRVLLVVLAGRPLEQTATKTLLQSKKKEKISVAGHSTVATELTLSKRAVPSSFDFAIEKIISDTIATMDTSFIRVLATHPTGNPTLQLLLELELSNPNTKKGVNSTQKTIISSLLPDDITVDGSESAIFVNGILYDAIGSRLLETIMTFAPGKLFKQIYRTIFKDRIAALARNEISSYVVIRVFNRISKEDIEEAVQQIHPQVQGLVERRRTMVIKTLLERCYARGAETETLTRAIESSYGSDSKTLVLKMAAIDDVEYLIKTTTVSTSLAEAKDDTEAKSCPPVVPLKPSSSQLHGSLLAQVMLSIPGAPTSLIQTALLSLSPIQLLALSLWTTTSHIIQSALSPLLDITFRRKLINNLLFTNAKAEQDPLITLSLSSTGSHVLDTLLRTTTTPSLPSTSIPLFSITERAALNFVRYESQLRDSFSSRIVWRNWSMDLFKRRRADWVKKLKDEGTAAATSQPITVLKSTGEDVETGEAKKEKKQTKDKRSKRGRQDPIVPKKSGIQLAREKFAAAKAMTATGGGKSYPKGNGGRKPGDMTGANAVSIGVES